MSRSCYHSNHKIDITFSHYLFIESLLLDVLSLLLQFDLVGNVSSTYRPGDELGVWTWPKVSGRHDDGSREEFLRKERK